MLFSCVLCKKKESGIDSVPENFDYKILYGSWEIAPSPVPKKIIISPDRKVMLFEDTRITELALRVDLNAVQFKNTSSQAPVGYFLHEEKKGNSWLGVWDDEVVRLNKVNPENSGSVLE